MVDKEDYEISKMEVREKYPNDIHIETIIERADEYEEIDERNNHRYTMLTMAYYRLQAKYNKLCKECGKEPDNSEID